MNARLIADLQPHGAILPSIVFFNPTKQFVRYVKTFKPQPKGVVDVGAGMGRMARVLYESGVKVLAIDICNREREEFLITPLDAITLEYPAGLLPIMARPCHGPWVELAIHQALKTVPTLLYVGLERNIDGDLGGIPFKTTMENFKAGDDGEVVIRIDR